MKKLLILSSLTMLIGLSNATTYELNAANDNTIIESYGSNYNVLSTIQDIYDETKEIPDASTLYYSNMGYRKHMLHLYNDENAAHNITKQLFPYESFVKTSNSGIDYIPVKDSEGNQKYTTFYYNHYSENLHIDQTTGKSYIEFTIDITGMEYYLDMLVDSYKDKVKTDTLFEVPLVYLDNQEVCGYLIDTSQDEANVYIYSKVGTLEVTEDYGYYFLTFTAPYQSEIYDISLLNYSSFNTLEEIESFNYDQTWTTFIPATWMVEKTQPMLFEILDYDKINDQFVFGNSAYNAKNQTYQIDFDDYLVNSVSLEMYTAELNESGAPGNQSLSGSITVNLELVGKNEDGTQIYEIAADNYTLYEQHIGDAGTVYISEVNYSILDEGTAKPVEYKHTYGTYQQVSKFKYCKNPLTKVAYIDPQKFLIESSGLKTLYSNKFDADELDAITKHSNNKVYLGSVYEPKYDMSNTMFAESYAFNLSMDELNYKKIENPIEIAFFNKQASQLDDENTYTTDILNEDNVNSLLTNSNTDITGCGTNSTLINHRLSKTSDVLRGYGNYLGKEYDYAFLNFFKGQNDAERIVQMKPILVRYNVEAYETTKVNATGTFTEFGSYITGSEDENAPLYQMPSYNEESNKPSTTPGDENNNTSDTPEDEDNDNKPSIKDFFNKEDLKDNLKSILPIGLGVIGIIAVFALIFKKKK